jgi:hypothetical protein
MTCTTEIGNLLSIDGSPISFDGLPEHAFKMQFAKIPMTMFFLQGVDFPGIDIQTPQYRNPLLDLQEVGEKIIFKPFSINFLVDAGMKNHTEIFNWMNILVKSQNIADQVGDALLFINDVKYVRFVDAFPISLAGMQFRSNQDKVNYLTCSATFNFDWYEILAP